jgi:hypothetical protein
MNIKLSRKLVGEHRVRKFENGKPFPGTVGFYEYENGNFSWEFIPEGSQGSFQNFISELYPDSESARVACNKWLAG